jgi:hypothetical protein
VNYRLPPWGVAGDGGVMAEVREEGKVFFFEKKNQKTLAR